MLVSERVAAELRDHLSEGVRLGTLVRMPTLLGLSIVKAKASTVDSEAGAAAAAGLLKESCVRVDGGINGPAATLLGLADGTRDLGVMRRRKRAAEDMAISESRFRHDREAKLLLAVGEDLVIADSAFQARQIRDDQQPEAVDSSIQINWLERHEAYRRIWTPVMALKLDLEELLAYLRTNREAGVGLEQMSDASPVAWPDIADRGMNLMWRRAQFTSAVDKFVEGFGGLWLLSDPNQEQRAAEAIYQLSFHGPCGDADDSWLRLRLAEAKDGELDDFIDVVYANETGKDMLRAFLAWADQCRCELASGVATRPSCDVHGWIAAGDEYIALIDEDWDNVADWYRDKRARN